MTLRAVYLWFRFPKGDMTLHWVIVGQMHVLFAFSGAEVFADIYPDKCLNGREQTY